MGTEPPKNAILSARQFAAVLTALTVSSGLPGATAALQGRGPDPGTERAVERIADELTNIRRSLVLTQIDTGKALATAMEELSDHARRIEKLEDHRRR